MLKENIINLRNSFGYSQEEVAEKIGISRQAYAKWEKGETIPDIEKCAELAKVYNTTLDRLYKEMEVPEGLEMLEGTLPPNPKGKHIFGTVTMNEKGQIVIPKKAREIMNYKPGESLLVLGDESTGLAILRTKDFISEAFAAINEARKKGEQRTLKDICLTKLLLQKQFKHMSTIQIFHGSSKIIENPQFGAGKNHNDYGLGFYCTENLEMAKEWACPEKENGFANKYEIETNGLKILNLSSAQFTALNWLAILIENRRFDLDTPLMRQGFDYLKNNFLPDYSKADIITGWRADDSYFSFAKAFLSNQISYNQLTNAMKLGKLGEQFVLKSEKSFHQLKFTGYENVDYKIYYSKRKKRDDDARLQYKNVSTQEDITGLFMIDVIREEIKSDDSRLR